MVKREASSACSREGLRTITGLVGRSNRDNYKVTTAVATIGIRGTEYTGAFTPGDGRNWWSIPAKDWSKYVTGPAA